MPLRTLASPLPRRRSGKKRRHARITVEDIDKTLRKEEARLFPKSGGRGKGVSRIDDALDTDEVRALLPRRPSLLAMRGRARLVHELRVFGWGAHVLPVGAQLSERRPSRGAAGRRCAAARDYTTAAENGQLPWRCAEYRTAPRPRRIRSTRWRQGSVLAWMSSAPPLPSG